MTIRILGIDPGSRITGFGIIDIQSRKATYITSGCIRLKTDAMPVRLNEIFESVNKIIEQYQPSILSIEQVFVYRNAASALKLAQARAVAIVAAMQHSLSVYEYAPTKIKQTIVGTGHADKVQVQQMVKLLLNLPGTPQADAADALAIALCHSHHSSY